MYKDLIRSLFFAGSGGLETGLVARFRRTVRLQFGFRVDALEKGREPLRLLPVMAGKTKVTPSEKAGKWISDLNTVKSTINEGWRQ
jgi:hypothetical protein